MALKRTCDICTTNTPATVDTKTKDGRWAYLCDAHNASHGCGIKALTNDLSKVPSDE